MRQVNLSPEPKSRISLGASTNIANDENLINGILDGASKTKYVLNLFIEGEDEQSVQDVQKNNEQALE
jgi:hypothetical protein